MCVCVCVCVVGDSTGVRGLVYTYALLLDWSPDSFLKTFILFIYFWLCWVFVAARGLSLVAVSGGLLFIAVRGLLVVVASLVAEHGF